MRNETYRSVLVGRLVALLSDVVHVQPKILKTTKDARVAVQVGRDTSESRAGSGHVRTLEEGLELTNILVAALDQALTTSGLSPK